MFIIFALWLLVLEVFVWFRDRKYKGKKQYTWTVWLTDPAFFAMIGVSLYQYFSINGVNMYVSFTGIAVVAIGLLIQSIAILTLGRLFSGYVILKKGHRVVRSGVYRYVRHPAYVGASLQAIGFPLILNAHWGLIFSVLFVITLLIKIKYEERVLAKQLPEYEKYQKEVGMLIPKLW